MISALSVTSSSPVSAFSTRCKWVNFSCYHQFINNNTVVYLVLPCSSVVPKENFPLSQAQKGPTFQNTQTAAEARTLIIHRHVDVSETNPPTPLQTTWKQVSKPTWDHFHPNQSPYSSELRQNDNAVPKSTSFSALRPGTRSGAIGNEPDYF